MHCLSSRLIALVAVAALVGGCSDDDTVPTTALPGGLDLGGLSADQRGLVRVTLEISNGALPETELVLSDDLTSLSGAFTVQNVEAAVERTMTLRVFGRFAATSEEVLLGRLEKPITLEPERDVAITFGAADVFDTCDGEPGACAVLFDANRNGASNIEDLLERTRSVTGIDPAPQAPYLVTSSEQLQFPSGVRLGSFARQLVVLENFGEHPVTITEAAVVGGQGFSISILDPTGQSVAPPGRSLDGAAFRAIAPGQEAFVAVSFTPVNGFVTTGALFVRVQDQVTLVEQTARVKLIANPEGALRPADPVYVEPDLDSVTVDGGSLPVVAFPNAQLQSGDALIAEDALGAGLRQSGASLTLTDGVATIAFPADAAFAVDVAPGQRFSTAIDGLTSDVDIAVVAVNADGSIAGLACDDCRSANAGTSPEAVEFKNGDEARRVVVILGRIEPESDAPETEGALTVAETVSFRCSTTVSAGPEFADLDPILPTSGPLEGGIPVTLKGSGFDPRAKVSVGGAEALDVAINRGDDGVDTVTFTLPAAVGVENPASIIVENPVEGSDGQAATLLEAFTYQPPAPVIDELRPDVAPTTGGTTPITIIGRFFSARHGAPQVSFGRQLVDATFVSASVITVTPPPHVNTATAETVQLRVRNRLASVDGAAVFGSASNGVGFRYLVPAGPAPTMTAVSPSAGSVDGGTRVTISGTELRPGLQVFFAGRPASCDTPTSSTSVSCLTPAADAPGTISVTLVNADGQSAKLDTGYAYEIPSPSITSVFPARGITDGGTFLVVEGGGFRPGARVTFTQGDTVRAATAATRVSGTTMLVTTPPGTAGTATITITNLDNQTVTSTFTYFAPDAATPPPAITTLSPAVGDASGGYPVVISGTGFLAPSVVFGSSPVQVTSFVDRDPPALDELTVIAPASPTGVAAAVTVQVINDDGQAATNGFNYTFSAAAPPRIDRIDPSTFVQGQQTSFTVFGARFDVGARVLVGGQQASVTSVTSSAIQASIGGQLPLGTVMLVVENANGGVVSAPVTVAGANVGGGTPVVTSVSTTDVHANVAGDVITIFGDNLDQGLLEPQLSAPTQGDVAQNARILSRGRNVVVLELPALVAATARANHTLSLRFTIGTSTTTLTVPLVAHRPVVFFGDTEGGDSSFPSDLVMFGEFLNPNALESVEYVFGGVRVPCNITTATERTIACSFAPLTLAPGEVYVPVLTWRGSFGGVAQSPPVEVIGRAIGTDAGISGKSLDVTDVSVVRAFTDFALFPQTLVVTIPGFDPAAYAEAPTVRLSGPVTGTLTTALDEAAIRLDSGFLLGESSSASFEILVGGNQVAAGSIPLIPRTVGNGSPVQVEWSKSATYFGQNLLSGDRGRLVAVRDAGVGGAPVVVPLQTAGGFLQTVIVNSTVPLAPGPWSLCFSDQVQNCSVSQATLVVTSVRAELINDEENGIGPEASVTGTLDPAEIDRFFFLMDAPGLLPIAVQCEAGVTATLRTRAGGVVADLCATAVPIALGAGTHVITLENTGAEVVPYSINVGAPQPVPECGNGIVEVGEDCDEGIAQNGATSPQLICNFNCTEPPGPFSLDSGNPLRTLTPGDEDTYTFTMTARGDLSVFTTERIGTSPLDECAGSLTLTIDDLDGRPLVTTTQGDGECAFARVTVDPGVYTARLRASSPGQVLRTRVGAFVLPITCGNGILDNDPSLGGSEQCDDADANAGDGCNRSCRVEAGFVCNGVGPGSCVPGNTATCTDGVVEGAEECDEGGRLEAGCNGNCFEIDEPLDVEGGPFIGAVPTAPRARTLAANDIDRLTFDLATAGDIRVVLSNREGPDCGTSLANATLSGPISPRNVDLAPNGCIDFVVSSLVAGTYQLQVEGTSTPLKYEVRIEAEGGIGSFCGDGVIDGPQAPSGAVSPTVFVSGLQLFGGRGAGVTIDDKGDAFVVSNDGQTPRIMRVTPAEVTTDLIPSPVGLVKGADIEIGPDGFLYVADGHGDGGPGGGVVLRIDPTTGASSIFIDQLDNPTGLAFDANGDLLVATFTGRTLDRFDITGQFLATVVAALPVAPLDVERSPTGEFFIAGTDGNDRNTIYRVSGTTVDPFGTTVGLDDPHSLAFDGVGTLWATIYNGAALVRFPAIGGDPDLVHMSTFAPSNLPNGLAFNRAGDAFVLSNFGSLNRFIKLGFSFAEACDDTNTDSTDGCSAACVVEPDFTCTGEPSECTPVGPPPGCQAFNLQSLPNGFVGGGGTFGIDGYLPGVRTNALSSMPLQFPIHAEVDIVFNDEDDIAFFGTRYSGAATSGNDEVDNLVYARFHNAGTSEQLELGLRQQGEFPFGSGLEPAPFGGAGTAAGRVYRAFFDDDGVNFSVGVEDTVNQVSSPVLGFANGTVFGDRFVMQATNTQFSNLLLCSPTFAP